MPGSDSTTVNKQQPLTPSGPPASRRSFATLAIYGLWTLIGGALAIPAGIYLLFPPRLRKGGDWVEVGEVAKLQPDVPEELMFRRNKLDGWKLISQKVSAWVVKTPGQGVIAFGPQCPHLGCAYHWEERSKEFFCPCHNSTFSMDGKVLTGPSPRALDRYEVKVDGAKLLLGPLHRSDERAL